MDDRQSRKAVALSDRLMVFGASITPDARAPFRLSDGSNF
jgi:hypothetical protein